MDEPFLRREQDKDEEKEKKDTNTWFKKGAFDDGYQFGDATKTILGTVGDAAVNIGEGIFRLGEGIGDTISYGIADVHDLLGNDEAAEGWRKRTKESATDKVFSPAEEFVDKASVLGDKSDTIAEGLGYVAGITAVGYFTGGVGTTATTFVSSYGHGVSEALNDGATIGEARIYGAISGAGEAVSELMFGGLGKLSGATGLSKGIGGLDDMLIGGLTKKIKNKMVKTVVQTGLKATGEGLEEVVSGLISAAGKKASYMSEREYSDIVKDEKLAEQFWMGCLTSAIAQGPTSIKSIKSGTDIITGKTENEQKVYDNEVKTRADNKVRQATIEQAYNEQVKAYENLGIKINKKAQAVIMKNVENAYDNGKLEAINLNKKDLGKIEKQVQKDMEDGNISLENIMNILGENKDISNDNLLMRSMYENEQKYNSYQVQQTDNEKVNVLMQSAVDAGMNNTNKTRRKVELIAKLTKDTDRQYKFVSPEQLKEMGYKENANGLIDKSTGEILINVQSNKGIQSIVGHETTHIFDNKIKGKNSIEEYSKEYQELQKAAIEYAKTKGIYEEKVGKITSAYKDLLLNESQIKEELTADLVGDFLFNDETFIEKLAVNNRNIFQKIYDYIKHTYKMMKGTDEEKAFEELKNRFENVYKTLEKTSNQTTSKDTKYSIAGKKAMRNAIIADTSNIVIEKSYNKAQQMANNNIDNETIRKTTNWFQDKNGDWKFEFSDKDMSLKNIKLKAGNTYKLGEILEHDILFMAYPELANYEVKILSNTKANGSFNRFKKIININSKLVKDNKLVEGTLIHEIQHAIQNIEGFERGRGSRKSKLAYYNSLGEIEAADTKDRFIQEKYKNKNIYNIAPESSKSNPKHRDLNRYLMNRNIVDKIKDGIYNYFSNNNGGNVNEINQEIILDNTKQDNSLVDGRRNLKNIEGTEDSNKSSFSMDNKGRTLTKEQQTFFKDSKARDKNGNLLEVYHGTNEDFTEFDISYLGSASGDVGFLGDGFYLATHKGEAGYYGNKVMSGYVNIKNPYNIKELSKYNGKTFNGEDSSNGLHIKNLVDLNPQWRNIEINNTTYGEIADEVKKYLENVKIKKLGIVEDSYGNDSGIMWEISFSGKKNRSESILNYTEEEMIANELNRHIRNEFGYINSSEIIQYITEENRINKNIKTLREVLQEKGYDSIVQGNPQDTDEIVIFDSNQFKNVDNANPTDNPDIRHSLTKDTQITGDDIATRDLLKEERPTIEDEIGKTEAPTVEVTNPESNTNKYNRYKQNILKARETEINNLIKEKNNTIREIEQQIASKEKLLSNKKDQTTKVANDLKMQIESLKQRKSRIENEYNRKIDKKNEKVTKDRIDIETKKQLKLTRKEVKKKLLQEMGITEKDISVGEDISSFNFQITDTIRANEKVFGKEIGTKINDATVNKTKKNTAEKIRWQKQERKEIKDLGIKARSKESAAVQKYGEKKYVDENGNIQKYGDVELAKEFTDVAVQEKIKNAAKVIREKYDVFLEQANNVLTGLGYNPIPKREDYMRHFQELTDKFSQAGVPLNLNEMKADDLPTDINGLTAFNQPGKNWFASALQRTGEKTVYDAITGIDGYIEGVGNLIYHTGDIQNYRALSSMIRDTYGQKHGLDNIENMTEEERAQRIKDVQNKKLSKYVAWLDEQANSLAGKKGFIDRGFENMFGRKIYNVMNTAKKQVGSNMTGFNVRSSLTNLISTAIAASKTKKVAFAQGTISTINNIFKKDDFIDKSDFLTSRFGSDTLSQKFWQKASNVGQIFMTGTDWFTSNLIVRSKYYEGLSKNMIESEAIKYADDFAARVMGDRSQGATAEIFNSKTLGLLTQFQLEVNNQWQFMIHDTKMDYQQNKEENSGLKAGATAIFQMGQLAAYSYFFNELFEKLTGSRAAFDPIEIIKTLFGLDDEDDEEKTFEERLSKAGGLLVDSIPFANLFTDGGRIPVSEAFTGASTLLKKVTGGTDEYGNAITWEDVKDDTLATIPYWVMPTGYGQLKKTVKGLSMYSNDVPGSYTDSGNLRYTVEEDVGSKVQAAMFGAYANPYAQDYIDSGFKTIKKDNIDEMVGLDMNSTEYRQFKSNLSKVQDTSDKNGYKQYIDENGTEYWYDANSETMYDSKYNKTTLTEDDLTKVSKKEEALNYINSLDLTDAQKNLVANNLNKNSKKTIDMSEYNNYDSYDEYTYARDNPEKYTVVSQISAYDDYVKYRDAITDIKKEYSTEAGYSSKERKAIVQNYIESLDLNMYQKMMLEKMAGGYSIKNYKNYIYEYLEQAGLSQNEKYTIWEELFN